MSNSELYFKILGEGSPIIFLHGLLGSHTQWYPFRSCFSSSQLILPDLPNHGNSPHTLQTDYTFLAEYMLSWIDSLSLKSPTVIAHSLGGRILLKMMELKPSFSCVPIFIDCSASSLLLVEEAFGLVYRLEQFHPESFFSYKQIAFALSNYRINGREADLVLKNIQRQGLSFSWKSNFALIRQSLDILSEEIKLTRAHETKALLITVANSHYVTEESWMRLKRFFPNMSMQRIENAGHWIHYDQPEAFATAIVDFLRK